MNVKTVLPFFVCLAVMLHAPAASGQYTSRAGLSGGAQQESDGASAGLGLAFVTYLSGESLFMSTDDEDWVALSPNLSLRIGDRIWVQDGARLEIRFPLGATAWVNFQSELDITRLERTSRNETIQLALVSGEAAFDVKGLAGSGSVFQVDLPNASIRTSRAARFRVNTLPDGTAQIGVISGSLVLETPDGSTDVSAGRMAEIQPDQRVLLDFLPSNDEWDDWVQSRAEIYERPAASARYLPADLSSYAHEFDTSGRWVRDRTYGSVWVPAVERGWSPYSNGRWVWQADDYVWLPYDPWYAPFHFGRWSWGVSLGWFWIAPQGRAFWSPGYVGWSVIDDEVSWVPLGHNEVYYGYGNFGARSVNISRTTTVNVTNVYVNSRVTNGVVAVRKDDFLRGRIRNERIVSARNPFEGGGAGGLKIIGRPPVREIRPIRETRQPRPEVEIKRTSLPPVRLEKASRIIQQRVVAPTREKSVFKPGNKPAPLRNVLKEKELEQWVAPKRMASPRTVVAPPPAQRPRKDVAPAQPTPKAVQVREVRQPAPRAAQAPEVRQPAPKVGRVREVQQPAGKRQFKRISEPQGGANETPAPVVVPVERVKGKIEKQPSVEERDKEKQPAEEERGKEKGRGAGKR